MNDVEAVTAEAVAYANAIVQGTTAPYEGAKALWNLSMELEVSTSSRWPRWLSRSRSVRSPDLEELADALEPFVGLASEWEDIPRGRAPYEYEIRLEAERFVARFGMSPAPRTNTAP